MPTQVGQASVWGIDGTCAIDGASALAALVDAHEDEQTAAVDEFMDGAGELIGFAVTDKRLVADITLIPKKTAGASSLNDALAALAPLPIPAKVTLAGFKDTSTPSLTINGDYIYKGGARRTFVRGRAAYKFQAFRPLTSSLTVTQLLTTAV